MDAPGELDIEHLRSWIGRTETAEDIVTPRLVAEYRATFDPHLAPVAEGEAPLGLHWCLSPAIRPMAELGPDGHPRRGGFLPPVPLPRRMWAGGLVEPKAPLRVGDTVVRRSTIADVSAKHGRTGTLCFVTVRHDYETALGLAVSERQDIVYREASPGGAPAPAAPAAPAGPVEGDHVAEVETPPVFLFRYSAVTFNGHRIHYDLPYVTSEEGYAGLVVHGPIQATLLLNAMATLGGTPPARMRYRGVAPLTAGPPVSVAVSRKEAGIAGRTVSHDGRTCMEADADS